MSAERRDALNRILQAQIDLLNEDREPQPFRLCMSARPARIGHPKWSAEWTVPTERTVRELAERGLVQIGRDDRGEVDFTLTERGRQEAVAQWEDFVYHFVVVTRATGTARSETYLEHGVSAQEFERRLLRPWAEGRPLTIAGNVIERRNVASIRVKYADGRGIDPTAEASAVPGQLDPPEVAVENWSGDDITEQLFGSARSPNRL